MTETTAYTVVGQFNENCNWGNLSTWPLNEVSVSASSSTTESLRSCCLNPTHTDKVRCLLQALVATPQLLPQLFTQSHMMYIHPTSHIHTSYISYTYILHLIYIHTLTLTRSAASLPSQAILHHIKLTLQIAVSMREREGGREGGREREGERERERERETDRQTDRQTDRERMFAGWE